MVGACGGEAGSTVAFKERDQRLGFISSIF
jgi:hypothetical protein